MENKHNGIVSPVLDDDVREFFVVPIQYSGLKVYGVVKATIHSYVVLELRHCGRWVRR
jgi:hypothetical protein